MDHNVAVVYYQPPGLRRTFDAALPFVLDTGLFDHAVCQGLKHPAAGGGTDNEVGGEGSQFFNIQQKDVFSFLVFQGIDNSMCKFQGIQMSPLVW
jgi:hypothetical protein